MKEASNNEGKGFVPFNYPCKPSNLARALIIELNKLCRQVYHYEGPAVEYRTGIYWIDIAFIFSDDLKFALEIDDPHHDDPIYREKDKRKDKYLKDNKWRVKRIHHSTFDSYKEISDLARDILFEISLSVSEYEKIREKYLS